MEAPNYLTIEEFSRFCGSGASVPTVRRRIKDGSLKHIQLGGPRHRILIHRDALEQFRASPPPDSPASPVAKPKPTKKSLSGPKAGWRNAADAHDDGHPLD